MESTAVSPAVASTGDGVLERTWSRVPDLASTEMDGEIILMNPETGKYYTLAGPARTIWLALGEPVRGDTLCRELMRRYEVDEVACRHDVARFLTGLLTERLVVGS